jgi:peptide/nickel transport system permease protein
MEGTHLNLSALGMRLAGLLLSLWGVATIVFFVTRWGGDPAAMMLPPGTAAADIEAFRHTMGFDRPLLGQYAGFLGDVVRGNFGYSFENGRPAFAVIMDRMPASIELAGAALLYGIVVGGFAGYVAAVRRGGIVEFLAMSLALLGQATPKFWLGLMLVLYFSVYLGVLPTGGRGDWTNLVMPAVSLGTFAAASIARFLRASMLKVLDEDYVRTAWSKGLRKPTVYSFHVVRNALIPVVTVIGLLVGELIGNAVIIETIFSWPGVGRAIIQAIERKDFAVVQAGVITLSFIFIVTNMVVDVLYTILDPRVRVE